MYICMLFFTIHWFLAPSSEMTLSSKLNDAISSKTSPSDIVAILDELDQLSPDLTPQGALVCYMYVHI